MAGNEFLDKQGVSALWERIKELVYECCCKNITTYHLESDGNTVTLVGSDGTRSSVAVISTASCGDTPIEPTIEMSVHSIIDQYTYLMTTNITITVDEAVSGATIALGRETANGQYKTVQTWSNQALTGTMTFTATEQLDCSEDSWASSRTMKAVLLTSTQRVEATDTYIFRCME